MTDREEEIRAAREHGDWKAPAWRLEPTGGLDPRVMTEFFGLNDSEQRAVCIAMLVHLGMPFKEALHLVCGVKKSDS